MNTRNHAIPTRRDGRRTLCAAEGVVAVLRHCSLDDAFRDIVSTAQRHNVAPLRLAEQQTQHPLLGAGEQGVGQGEAAGVRFDVVTYTHNG